MGSKKKKIYIDGNCYKRFCDSDKLVHRHVAEMKLRCKLRTGEVVHHINRNKLDNRRSNIRVFKSQQKHYKIHKEEEKKYGQWLNI